MKYCFQLWPHANSHYRQSQAVLGANELRSLLLALHTDTEIAAEEIGGCLFFTFESPGLDQAALTRLADHSSLLLMAVSEGGMLMPLPVQRQDYLPRECSEVLKYKGKTSASFTRMMLNMALSAAGQEPSRNTTVLDPMCGRGTTCFCALEMGMNAVGIDVDQNDLNELITYFTRFLTRGRYKHSTARTSETRGGRAIPSVCFTLADTKEHYSAGDTRTLQLFRCDTASAGALLKKRPADILTADLPYGIQHAPQDGRKPEGFTALLARALPCWRDAVRPGGAMALSFNTFTLKRNDLAALCVKAGWQVPEGSPWCGNEHFVEQAVSRDILIAVRP